MIGGISGQKGNSFVGGAVVTLTLLVIFHLQGKMNLRLLTVILFILGAVSHKKIFLSSHKVHYVNIIHFNLL